MTTYVEPLDSASWFRQIEKIADGEFASIENALRHASHLLQLTPLPFRHVVGLATDEDRFEALLESGDFDTAARNLIGQPAALSLEHPFERQKVRATISCSILGRVIHGTGETVATAVLDAWTTCLLALKAAYGADLLSVHPPEHRRRSEPGRRLH